MLKQERNPYFMQGMSLVSQLSLFIRQQLLEKYIRCN